MKVWALLLVLVIAGLARAENCVLDPRVLANQFGVKLPKGFRLLSTRKDPRSVRQVLRRPDGAEVTVELGGCERVQYRFIVKSAGLTTRTVGAEAVAVARRALGDLPMAREALAEPRVLLHALEEGSFTSLPATMACGASGLCRIELRPDSSAVKKGRARSSQGKQGPPDESEGPAVLVLAYEGPG